MLEKVHRWTLDVFSLPSPSELFRLKSLADLRQCLIYDSHGQNAGLVGVEYMLSKGIYDRFDEGEQKLWHSHDFEVKSGMLIPPKPSGYTDEEWKQAELEVIK